MQLLRQTLKNATKRELKTVRVGQPRHETHPHLLDLGEITPGIPASEYKQRRTKLLDSIESKFSKSSFTAIIPGRGSGNDTFHLFVNEQDKHTEIWEGPIAGTKGAVDVFHADELTLWNIMKNRDPVFMDQPSDINTTACDKICSAFQDHGSKIRPIAPFVQQLRLIKSENEIKVMRKAGEIAAKAFIQAMKNTKPEMTELEIEARIEFECKKQGAQKLAYVPVVASGSNALTIHYVANNDILKDGDLILVDAGAQYGGYCSDITRTWPVNGRFSAQQRDLYQALLNVQKKCINMCAATGISLDDIYWKSLSILRQELTNANIHISEKQLEMKYYPHHSSHYLGLDVHDVAQISRKTPLKKGMVVTIGIRIEDDIVVGEKHPVILSVTAPKEIVDIEALMS